MCLNQLAWNVNFNLHTADNLEKPKNLRVSTRPPSGKHGTSMPQGPFCGAISAGFKRNRLQRRRGRSRRRCGDHECSMSNVLACALNLAALASLRIHDGGSEPALVSSNANVGIARSLCCRSQQPNESDTTMFLRRTKLRSNFSHVVNEFRLSTPSSMNTVNCGSRRHLTFAGALTHKTRTRNKTGGASSVAP